MNESLAPAAAGWRIDLCGAGLATTAGDRRRSEEAAMEPLHPDWVAP